MKDIMFEKYTIKKGDTLYGVSKKYNINPDLLALINGLTMSDYIYENQEILIPKNNYSYYLTQSGDDLDSILNLLNIDYVTFKKNNNKILLESGQLFGKQNK